MNFAAKLICLIKDENFADAEIKIMYMTKLKSFVPNFLGICAQIQKEKQYIPFHLKNWKHIE